MSLVSIRISLWLYRKGRCSLNGIILAPVVGVFLFILLVIILAFMSGEM